jgi:hypothetical protein
MRRTESQVKAHQGVVQGLECNGNWVYTIGLGIRYELAISGGELAFNTTQLDLDVLTLTLS